MLFILKVKDDITVVGRFCGRRLPSIITSRTNLVRIRFHTDYKDHGKGFNATYLQTPGDAQNVLLNHIVTKQSDFVILSQ